MFATCLFIICLISIGVASNFDTTNNQIDKQETSTTSLHITTNELSLNKTESTLNINNVTVMTTTVNNIPSSTDTVSNITGRSINGKLIFYNTTSHYYNYTTTSSSALSTGAIAGIIIGVIVLICCVSALGCWESGHSETHKV